MCSEIIARVWSPVSSRSCLKRQIARQTFLRIALGCFFLSSLCSPAAAVVQASFDGNTSPSKRTGEMQRVVMLRYTPLRILGGCGILCGPRTVLTAKHAVGRWPVSQLSIDLADEQKTHLDVQRVALHPDGKVDLAIIHLKQSLQIKPIRLLNRKPKVAERVWLGGYGIYGGPGKPISYGKFHAGFNMIATVHNGRATVVLDDLKERANGEALPARFDSGSPVWLKTKQGWALSGVTVTATGSKSPGYGDRSSHQLVAPVREWLSKVMAEGQE